MSSSTPPLGHRPEYPDVRDRILKLYSAIASLDCLDPGPATNEAFTNLITLITFQFDNSQALGDALMLDETIVALGPDLVRLCADAEGRLEAHWSRRLVDSAAPSPRRWFHIYHQKGAPAALDAFPYLQNYRSLVRLEAGLLEASGADLRHVIFIGSGPLPLSPLILGRDHIEPSAAPGWSVVSVDSDVAALEAGANLVAAALATPLSPATETSSLEFRHRSGTFLFIPDSALSLCPALLAKASVVCLAALVGLTLESKLKIAMYLISHMRAGSFLLARSADGLRSLAYPVVPHDAIVSRARELGTPVELVVTAHPRNEIVNSVVVFQRVRV